MELHSLVETGMHRVIILGRLLTLTHKAHLLCTVVTGAISNARVAHAKYVDSNDFVASVIHQYAASVCGLYEVMSRGGAEDEQWRPRFILVASLRLKGVLCSTRNVAPCPSSRELLRSFQMIAR